MGTFERFGVPPVVIVTWPGPDTDVISFAAVRLPPVVITTSPSARAPCMVIAAVSAGAEIVNEATLCRGLKSAAVVRFTICGPMSLLSVMLPVVAEMLTGPSVSSTLRVTSLPAANVRLWPSETWMGELAVVTISRPAASDSPSLRPRRCHSA
jgi:hypothetical protein